MEFQPQTPGVGWTALCENGFLNVPQRGEPESIFRQCFLQRSHKKEI